MFGSSEVASRRVVRRGCLECVLRAASSIETHECLQAELQSGAHAEQQARDLASRSPSLFAAAGEHTGGRG